MIKNQILYKQVVHQIALLVFMVLLSSLMFSSSDDQALISAIEHDQIDKAIELIKSIETNKINLNLKNHDGETALMFACDRGHKKIAQMIIDANVDLNIQDNDSQTALMFACDKGHIEIVDMLIKSKANINIQNHLGNTSLICTCYMDHKEIVKILLSVGANINIQNKTGNTALIRACARGHKEIVDMLIEANANINIQNDFGDTALMWTCHKGHKEIVQMLIDNGADINIQNNDGNTAFDYAKEKPEILSILDNAQNYKSNCYCKHLICNSCKVKMQILPILKSDKSNLNQYIRQVRKIIKNNQMRKKLAIKILDELIAFNDERSIKLKNRLRLLNYVECKECNALLCRECQININSCSELCLEHGAKRSR